MPTTQTPPVATAPALPAQSLPSSVDSTVPQSTTATSPQLLVPPPTRLVCRLLFYKHARARGIEEVASGAPLVVGLGLVDGFYLFEEIVRRGGAARVTLLKLWADAAAAVGLAGSGTQVKTKYEECLLPLETDALLHALRIADPNAGAEAAGLNPLSLSPIETHLLPELSGDMWRVQRYLDARNHVLQLWSFRPHEQLALEHDVISPLQDLAFGEEVDRLKDAFFVLETLGIVNSGCVRLSDDGNSAVPPPVTQLRPWTGRKVVVVVGAGLAGLTAAAQLARFGHEIIVVEARRRVGGRVLTTRVDFPGSVVELGAMVITGLNGHPCALLADQLQQPKHVVREDAPIYALNAPLDPTADTQTERTFNTLMDSAAEAARAAAAALWGRADTRGSGAATLTMSGRAPAPRFKGRAGKTPNGSVTNSSGLPRNGGGHRENHVAAVVNVVEMPAGCSAPELSSGSKYHGVCWNYESGGEWRAFVLDATGRRVDLGRGFKSELDAARARDVHPLALALPCSRLNAALFPGDFRLNSGNGPNGDLVAQATTARVSNRIGDPATLAGASAAAEATRLIEHLESSAVKGTTGGAPARVDVNAIRGVKRALSLAEGLRTSSEKRLAALDPAMRSLTARVLEWHLANLEYGCAADVARVSAEWWDQDDEFSFGGAHAMLPNGFAALPEGLARTCSNLGVKFVMDAKVESVTTGQDRSCDEIDEGKGSIRPHIRAVDRTTGSEIQLDCDAVLMTVSLGVLQAGDMTFDPALPEWKSRSIRRLGMGNLNKVVMEFDRAAWTPDHDVFGRVVFNEVRSKSPSRPETPLGRGFCFTFWSLSRVCPDRHVVIGLVAGDDADRIETMDDECVVELAWDALKQTCASPNNVPRPTRALVTRWGCDEFARGSYSYVGLGASAHDYLVMSQRVGSCFFAGEATSREHPATTGGAVASGLREAAKICARHGRRIPATMASERAEELLSRLWTALEYAPRRSLSSEDPRRRTLESLVDRRKTFVTTRSDGCAFASFPLRTEGWFHRVVPFSATDRERAARAHDISSRLPAHWDAATKAEYVWTRLGPGHDDVVQAHEGVWL